MEALFCIEALEEALARHGKPEIFNTDQGSQFTCEAFTDVLLKNDIKISMDGKGAWRDNVFPDQVRDLASLAVREIRGGLPTRLQQRVGRQDLARAVSRSLQPPPPAFEP